VRLALGVQLSELVPGGHGSVIEALDDEIETVGADRILGSNRGLR